MASCDRDLLTRARGELGTLASCAEASCARCTPAGRQRPVSEASMMRSSLRLVLSLSASAALAASAAAAYDGVWVSGSSSSAAGAEALELIDKARRSLGEGPELEIEYQTMPMLYKGSEDGILEGPTWGCYWTQNSCAHRTDVTRSISITSIYRPARVPHRVPSAMHRSLSLPACRLPFCSVWPHPD